MTLLGFWIFRFWWRCLFGTRFSCLLDWYFVYKLFIRLFIIFLVLSILSISLNERLNLLNWTLLFSFLFIINSIFMTLKCVLWNENLFGFIGLSVMQLLTKVHLNWLVELFLTFLFHLIWSSPVYNRYFWIFACFLICVLN